MDKWRKNINYSLIISLLIGLFSSYSKNVKINNEILVKENKKQKTNELLSKIKKLKNKSDTEKKIFSTNEDIKKIIVSHNKKAEMEEKYKNKTFLKSKPSEEDITEEEQKKENIKIPLKNTKNLTEDYKDTLIKINTKVNKIKSKKYIPVIKEFSFLQPNFADLIYFFKNIKYQSGTYIYDFNIKLFNILWGINISSGIDIGGSFIKKDNIKNNVFFMNLNFGYKYSKQGHIELILGCSRIKYDNTYIWPLWFAITPLNFDFDIYKSVNGSKAINLNIQLLFKTIITEDMKRCIGKVWETDNNKILPYMGDLSNPNFLNIFVDLKFYLGFKYINEI